MATNKTTPKKPTTGKAGGTPAPSKRTAAPKRTAAKSARPAKARAPAPAKRGRPSSHTPALAAAVCEALMNGQSLRTVCAQPGMPAVSTVLRWIHDDLAGFRSQYARAREVQAELYADDVVHLADTTLHAVKRTVKGKGKKRQVEEVFGDAVERSRLMVEARKWYASKVAPKKFGEHLNVNETGEVLVTFRDLTGRKGEAPAQGGQP